MKDGTQGVAETVISTLSPPATANHDLPPVPGAALQRLNLAPNAVLPGQHQRDGQVERLSAPGEVQYFGPPANTASPKRQQQDTSRERPLSPDRLLYPGRPANTASPRQRQQQDITFDYSTVAPIQKGQIRLLSLHAGSNTDALEANFVCCWLNYREGPGRYPPPEFSALSYTWADGFATSQIKMIAVGGSHQMKIKPNLGKALRRLRRPDEAVFLWIDAICINQDNKSEKADQIPRLAAIYRNARHVCVWLDPCPNDTVTNLAFSHVNNCLAHLEKFDEWTKDESMTQAWAAFCSILQSKWFSRRWIVQEITGARSAMLYCGSHRIEWDRFMDMVSLFKERMDDIRKLFRESQLLNNNENSFGSLEEYGAVRLATLSDELFHRSDDLAIKAHLLSLEALMSTMTAFEASDPKDIVYALLWMAKDANPVAKNATTYNLRQMARRLDTNIRLDRLSPTRQTFSRQSSQSSGVSMMMPGSLISSPTELSPVLTPDLMSAPGENNFKRQRSPSELLEV